MQQNTNRTKSAVGFCGPVNSLSCLMMKQPITLLNTHGYRLLSNTPWTAHFHITSADTMTLFLDFSFSKKQSPSQSPISTTYPKPKEFRNELFPSLPSRSSAYLTHTNELLPSSRKSHRQTSGCAIRPSHAWFLPRCRIDISDSDSLSISPSSPLSSSTSFYHYDHEHQHQHQPDHDYYQCDSERNLFRYRD